MVWTSGRFGYSFWRGPSNTLPPAIIWPRRFAGLAGNAAQFLEPVVVGLELVIGDRVVLDGHLGRNRIAAVAILEMAPQIVVGRQAGAK